MKIKIDKKEIWKAKDELTKRKTYSTRMQFGFEEGIKFALKQVNKLVIPRVINWVACGKKLPKKTGDVLIYVDGLGVRNAIFNITDNSFSFNSIYKPTHWAELPKPPCL